MSVNGTVYKLIEKTKPENALYVGSTTTPLKYRYASHKCCEKMNPKRCIYAHTIEKGGMSKFELIPLVKIECTRKELLKLENAFIEILKPKLNMRKSYTGITMDANYFRNYKKQFGSETEFCECGKMIRKDNISRHRKTKSHKTQMNKAYLGQNKTTGEN
jgi:hypothetical protein